MSDLKDIYKISLRDYRAKAKKALRENEKAYDCLVNKNSDYANIILAMQRLHRDAAEIYDNAPDEIMFDHEPF